MTFFCVVCCVTQFDQNIIDEAFAVGKLGVIINSSINFGLYCVSGRRFRHEAYRLLACKRLGFDHAFFSSSASGEGHSASSGTGTTGM